MTSGTYVRWNDPAVEPETPGEQEKTQKLTELVRGFQERNFAHHRHGFRGTHVKTQGVVKGTMTVLDSLPSHLAQGLFNNGGKTHPVGIRFANEPSFLQDDRAPGPRGCGMKVFGVEGDFMDPVGERTHAQDFTFNNAPILELRDVQTCMEIFDIRLRNFENGEGLKKELEQREDKNLQFAPAGLPNQHFLSYVMYSQSAYRYGDYVAKYALFPTGKLQQELEKSYSITDNSDREQHSKWLRDYFAKNDAEYDFRVQLCKDIKQQSVEDTSVQWDESATPFETVARVHLPSQDSFDSKRRTFWDDQMKLNVWYGLKDFQPLGSVNRLRKAVYPGSVKNREGINTSHIQEVSSIDQIP